MQVANFFRDNVTVMRSTTTMNSRSESSFISLEENEVKTVESLNKDNTETNSNIPLSVSSLVNLASTVLNGTETFVKTKEDSTNDGLSKENEEGNHIHNQNILMQGNIRQSEEYSERLCNEDDKEKEKISQTFSPLSIDIKDRPTDIINQPISPHLEHSIETKKLDNLYKFNFNDSAGEKLTSGQVTITAFKENKNSLDGTFSMQISEGNQIETNPHSSSIIAPNISETHGCATKISDMDKTEAENLVIHEQDHTNTIPINIPRNNLGITQLMEPSKSGLCSKEQIDTHSPDEQQEQLNSQVHSREDQDQIASKCAKNNHYSSNHDFPECLQSDVNVEDLSNQNHQQMSGSQIDDIGKMEHMPSDMNLNNHVDTLQQYHHLHGNQDHIQHQHTQQFFVHHDQQHLMSNHRHQQHHHHHSDLMTYLHRQDQTTMQHPHHIRTYQHYQQQQQRLHQSPYPQTSSPLQPQKHGPLTCIDDLMIDEFHEDPNNRYKMLSPTVKHESQDDGYETSAGDVLTPNSHSSSHSMTPQHQMHSVNLLRPKCDNMTPSHQTDQDPYNFIDDEMNSNIRMVSPSSNNGISITLRQHNYESSPDPVVNVIRVENEPMTDANNTLRMQSSNTNEMPGDIQTPKKRGRKKKSNDDISERSMIDGDLKPILQKERKKHDRFNGMPEEEVSKRTLPDHLASNLDIIIIGINPGLFAAYKGHHYAGPGNHFWKCLYLSGLTHEQMTAEEDYKLLKIGIGFTNMVERATKGSADLTRKEIKEGSRILLDKLQRFRPKIAVFNGKLIFEVFSGKKDFNFGRQQECVEGTDTYMWVMPSSSARCAQLPRAADKVPFYTALKKFRDYLNGLIPHIDDLECVFNDPKAKLCCESEAKGSLSTCAHFLSPDCPNSEKECLGYNNTGTTIENNTISNLNQNTGNSLQRESPNQSVVNNVNNSAVCGIILQGLNTVNNINPCNNVTNAVSNTLLPEKKKRGRPKKIKGVDEGESSVPHKIRHTNSLTTNNNNILNLTLLGASGEVPKKKRGRPKKIKIETGVTLRSDLTNSSNNNSGQVIGTNSINSDIIVTNNVKNIVCANGCSPNHIGSHQILTMNTCNQFNTQSMSQQQPLQNQRLFTSPMHSPDTASSYCSIGFNVTTTPPTGNGNLNNSNLANNGSYHQQLGGSNAAQSHHHDHIMQRAQHQLHAAPGIYLQSPNDTPQQQSKSPHYGSSHSDLSAEISAAISSDHLCESQSESSPIAITTADYDRPESASNDEHNHSHNLRFSSPPSIGLEQQRVDRSSHQIQHYHHIYQSGNSTPNYINVNNSASLSEARTASTSDDNISYIVSNRTQASNSNTNTPQPPNNSSQQNLHISDMSSKSLSGLESLVEQIPTIADNETQSQLTSIVGSVECRLKTDSDEGYPSPVSGNDTSGTISGGLGCIYVPTYSNLNSSTPSPSSSVPSNSSIISPHQYPDPTYSTANTCSSTPNSNDNINYNSLASSFSVSSLTSNSYSPNSYHTNIMAAPVVSSPHHVTTPASGNSMYMDSHLPVAVSTIYPHPYAQHAGYGTYNPVAPQPQPPTLHMPSPSYPYTYSNNLGYPNQNTTPTGYLTSHSSMFDRIKPDIGYGGY